MSSRRARAVVAVLIVFTVLAVVLGIGGAIMGVEQAEGVWLHGWPAFWELFSLTWLVCGIGIVVVALVFGFLRLLKWVAGDE